MRKAIERVTSNSTPRYLRGTKQRTANSNVYRFLSIAIRGALNLRTITNSFTALFQGVWKIIIRHRDRAPNSGLSARAIIAVLRGATAAASCAPTLLSRFRREP